MISNKNWREVFIPEELFFQEGPGVRNTQFRDTGVKLLNVGNINNGVINLASTKTHLSEEEAFGKYSHFLVDNGDLLIACSGIIVDNFHNKIAFANSTHLPLCLNTSTMRFKPLNVDSLNIIFFKYYLQSEYFKSQLVKLITGSAQLNFGPSHIKKIKIKIPPLEQQKKITAILDAADTYRQKTKALIAKYDELTQSLFLDMFGDPLKNEKGWEKKNLASILDFLTSGSRGWAKYYSDQGDLFLRIQNVGYNKLKLDDLCYVNTPNNAEAKRTKLIPGDIVLSITADLGRTAVIPENFPNAYINQHLAILRLTKENNPIYVSSFIASKRGQTLFNKLDKGGVKAGLNFTDIKSYNILCPPITLQNQFSERVQAIEVQKAKAQASLVKAEELFNSLLQRAFKGELV